MDNFILAFNTVFPLFAFMALGYLIKSLGVISDGVVKEMNRLIFKAFLSVNMFKNLYYTDLGTSFNGKLMLFSVCSIFLIFLIGFPLYNCIEPVSDRRGVLIQNSFRSNFLLYGVPVATSICGEAAGGKASMVAAVVVPMFNVLAVITLEIYKEKNIDVKKIGKGVLTNPLILGALLAVALRLFGIRLPGVIDEVVVDISNISTPLALLFLGAGFSFSSLKGRVRPLMIGIAARLIVVPAVFLTIAAFLGFRDADLVVLLAMFASPCAVSAPNMVHQIGGDHPLASQLVITTSLVSIFTIFTWIVVLKNLMLI